MKKLFAIIMAIVCLFGCCVFTVAAEQNYCDVFEFETNCMRYFQSNNVAPGGQFDALAIVYYTMQQMDVSAYLQEDAGVEYHIPGAVFEQTAMTHFAVTVTQLRALRLDDAAIYNADDQEYWVRERNNAGSETYFIRGYEKNGSRYTVYFNYVDGNYQIQPGDVEGVQYLLDWDTDIHGQPTEPQPVKLLEEKIKVTLEYDGENIKFLAWEHINAIPDLSGMTIPTKPDVSTHATTAPSGGTDITDETDGSTTGPSTGGSTGFTQPTSGKAHTTTAFGVSATRTTIKDGRVTTTGNGSVVLRTTMPTVPLETVIATDTVTLLAAAGTFPENVTVDILQTTTAERMNTVKRALDGIADRFTVYELTAHSDAAAVQPNGRVTATFAIPEGYEAKRTAVVYIAPNGVVEILVSRVDAAAGTVTAELSHFSTYAIAELHSANVADGPSALVIALLIVAAVGLIAGGIVYVKRRNRTALGDAAAEPPAQSNDE